MVRSQSSASKGSVDLVKVGGLKIPKLGSWLFIAIATIVVVVVVVVLWQSRRGVGGWRGWLGVQHVRLHDPLA
jgi:hypothetical protein